MYSAKHSAMWPTRAFDCNGKKIWTYASIEPQTSQVCILTTGLSFLSDHSEHVDGLSNFLPKIATLAPQVSWDVFKNVIKLWKSTYKTKYDQNEFKVWEILRFNFLKSNS